MKNPSDLAVGWGVYAYILQPAPEKSMKGTIGIFDLFYAVLATSKE